jgi:hypothetical protein
VLGERIEAVAVAVIECVQPGVEARERGRRARGARADRPQGAQLGDRGEPIAERVAVRFAERERDVGGDPGQHLVTGDQDAVRLVEQADMFGRVAIAGDDPPLARADRMRSPSCMRT